ncbi:MAG: helix-turn-helix domain-containing protein, partial [Halobacteriales archaeon]|nr:helix-turn-helix domain-containing protein [Halobacteriales archaeon]
VQRAFDELPPAVRDELDVEQLTEYVPDVFTLQAGLTARQREILDTAVDIGYYDDPRRATVADVASELGINQSTASEHLRKLEARVFRTLT